MQAVESQTLILYHTDLRGQWPENGARALAARLPYARRLALRSGTATGRASLAGTALALRALTRLLGRRVSAGEIHYARGEKPRLVPRVELAAAQARGAAVALPSVGAAECAADVPDFSVAHSGPWVGCAAVARGRVGLDIEMGANAPIAAWVVREAALKASGAGLRALPEVRALELRDDRAHWGGESWHVRRLEVFAGAAACVLSSLAPGALVLQAVPLEELFGP